MEDCVGLSHTKGVLDGEGSSNPPALAGLLSSRLGILPACNPTGKLSGAAGGE